MRISSLNYLIKEGFRNVWINRLMSIASVSVLSSCLIMIGVAALGLVNLSSLLDTIDEQNVVVVFIDDRASDIETRKLKLEIENIENVDEVKFISKSEGYETVMSGLKNASLSKYLKGSNAFVPASFEVYLKSMANYDETVQEISTFKNVDSIRDNRELAQSLVKIRSSASYISLGIVVLLLIISLFIVFNTVRITMLNRRLEISIMRSVGATNRFIRLPFMIEGMLLGIISSIVSILFVYGIYMFLDKSLASIPIVSVSGGLKLQPFIDYVLPLLVGFLVIGIFTGAIGSIVSTKKYLKEKVYDVVAEDD